MSEMKTVDMVNKPPHYTSGTIECIDYIEDCLSHEEFVGFLRGQVIKYQHRLMSKDNPIQDLRKLLWYAARLERTLLKHMEREHGC